MATSPLFGWEEPDDTDLVKDGAAAIRTLGNAIDTSMGDLLGGTTGQVLSKNSNTNMDFTWVTSDDANAIQNTIVDAKGDLIAASASDTPARLAVGANNTSLVADSAETTGMKWEGAWTTYTPTISNLSIGNGTLTARYNKVGKTINVIFHFIFGSTTTITSSPNFTIPFNVATSNQNFQAALLDSGTAWFGAFATAAGNIVYLDLAFTNGTYLTTAGGGFSSTAPFTWTTNDTIVVKGSYEAS